jgi:hypothetical protein
MKRLLACVFIFCFLVLSTACREAAPLTVEMHTGKLVYRINLQTPNQQILIQDIAVRKKQCVQNCIVWMLVSKVNDVSELTGEALLNNSIVYGAKLQGVESRIPAVSLNVGEYTVGGTVAFIENGVVIKSKIFSVDYTLIRNDSQQFEVIQ